MSVPAGKTVTADMRALGRDEDVRRSYARGLLAEMIQDSAGWDRADLALIERSVGEQLLTLDRDVRPTVVQRVNPDPAGALIAPFLFCVVGRFDYSNRRVVAVDESVSPASDDGCSLTASTSAERRDLIDGRALPRGVTIPVAGRLTRGISAAAVSIAGDWGREAAAALTGLLHRLTLPDQQPFGRTVGQ